MTRKRDFNPNALDPFVTEGIKMMYQQRKGIRGNGKEFSILLPRRLITNRGRNEVCSGRDEKLLRKMLVRHFEGFTAEPNLVQGVGLRGKQFETNEHRQFTVVAAHSSDALCYFDALCKELQSCSGEEQIFITCRDIVIL